MIDIKHKSATFRVLPENAEKTRELLVLIDKSKGAKGRKFKPVKPERRDERELLKRYYPTFYPGMTAMEYIRQYEYDNIHHHLTPWDYVCADRATPILDPTIPECEESENENLFT